VVNCLGRQVSKRKHKRRKRLDVERPHYPKSEIDVRLAAVFGHPRYTDSERRRRPLASKRRQFSTK